MDANFFAGFVIGAGLVFLVVVVTSAALLWWKACELEATRNAHDRGSRPEQGEADDEL